MKLYGIMELIRTLRQKQQTQRQYDIQRQAEDTICLSDFDNDMYIAYCGTPLVPINKEWTSVQILEELAKLRQNFINSKMKQQGLS